MRAAALPGTTSSPPRSARRAASAGAASYGALAVSQPGTLLHDPAAAPRATVVSDPDPAILLRDPAV